MRRLRRLSSERAARWGERRFVVEGPKLIAEALDSGARIESVYVDAAAAGEAHRALADRCGSTGAAVVEVADGVLTRVCDSVNPQPIAGIVEMVDVPLEDLRTMQPPLGLVAVGLQDPGNVGSIIRSAAAAGVGGVVLCPPSVDIYNPKAVRASAGALFRLPICAGVGVTTVIDTFVGWGYRLAATAPTGGTDYTRVDLTVPIALLLGNEASGLPGSLDGRFDETVSIPTGSGVESLNVATSAAVLCFEASRQRRAGQQL